MDGNASRRGKLGIGAALLLCLIGIAVLGSSGLIGVLILLLAAALAIAVVARA